MRNAVSRKHQVKYVFCPSKNQTIEVTLRMPGKLHLPDFDIVFCPATNDSSIHCNQECLAQLDMGLDFK